MGRLLRRVILVLLVASCGARSGGPPAGSIDDACEIVTKSPRFARAFRLSERRWGVPAHVQMATIYQESKFDGKARTPFRWGLGVIPMGRISSAYGYSQALDGTWDEYRQETHRYGARRDDIFDAADFIGWYMDASSKKLGISKSDARNQYLAYHEGRGGFARRSHRGKTWLLRVADKTAARARTYEQQLNDCRRW